MHVSESRQLTTLQVPTAFSALRWALAIDGERVPSEDIVYPPKKVGRLESSNEARYLTGILGMAGGLSGAQKLLLHPFFVDVFESFGGTTNFPAEKGVPTANRLKSRVQLKPSFDLRDEQDRTVLASLIVKASVELRKPMDYLSYEAIHDQWRQYRAAYWKANPQPVTPDDPEMWEDIERQTLDAALIDLRRRQILFQGHQWTCSRCHHRNWLDMSELAPMLLCKVCREEEPAPVDLKWLFRPNNFVIESLRDHSVLSLVWALTALQSRARQSFIFVEPTRFYFDRDSNKIDAEADLLVLLDNKTLLCEVKASWSIVRRSDIADLVTLAERLRPDTVVLAVMDKSVKLSAEIAAATESLKAINIEFELMTLDKCPLEDSPYLN